MKFTITDWAGNTMFSGKEFDTFEDAWDFLAEFFSENDMDFEEWAQEYNVEEIAA